MTTVGKSGGRITQEEKYCFVLSLTLYKSVLLSVL